MIYLNDTPTPSPTPPKPTLPTPFHFTSSLILLVSTKSNFALPMYSRVWVIRSLKQGHSTRRHALRENSLSPPWNHQLSRAPQFWVKTQELCCSVNSTLECLLPQSCVGRHSYHSTVQRCCQVQKTLFCSQPRSFCDVFHSQLLPFL